MNPESQKTKTRKEPQVEPSPDEMLAACECHTLAQMLLGHIATSRPWLFQPPFRPPRSTAEPHGASAQPWKWPR